MTDAGDTAKIRAPGPFGRRLSVLHGIWGLVVVRLIFCSIWKLSRAFGAMSPSTQGERYRPPLEWHRLVRSYAALARDGSELHVDGRGLLRLVAPDGAYVALSIGYENGDDFDCGPVNPSRPVSVSLYACCSHRERCVGGDERELHIEEQDIADWAESILRGLRTLGFSSVNCRVPATSNRKSVAGTGLKQEPNE